MIYPSSENFMVSSAGYETVQKISAINTRALTRLTELQVDIAKFGVETGLAQTKLFSSMDNLGDIFSLKSNLANQFFEEFVKMSEQTTGVLLESGDELFTVFEGMLSNGSAVPVTKTVAPTKPLAKATKPVKKANAKNVVKPKAVTRKSAAKKTVVKKKNK